MKARQQGTVISGANGLYYLRARYYDPSIGRFLTRDPLPGSTRDPQSLNAYPYVQNNPVNRVDPTGMLSEGPPSDPLLALLLAEGIPVDKLFEAKSCGQAIANIAIGLATIIAGSYLWTVPEPGVFLGGPTMVFGAAILIFALRDYQDQC